MAAKHKKVSFIITIVGLVIFLPLAVVGTIFHIKISSITNENHEFHFNNQLYFYDENDKLISTYDCNYPNCGYAKELYDDEVYGVDYYKTTLEVPAIVDKRYVFISDYELEQKEVMVYDTVQKKVIATYEGYKIYKIGISGNYVITKQAGNSYGVVQYGDSINNIMAQDYDFIGLQKFLNPDDKQVSSEKYIIKKGEEWYLADSSGSSLTTRFYEKAIVGYGDSTLITLDKEKKYNLYNYNGTPRLDEQFTSLRYITKDVVEVIDINKYYLIDVNNLTKVSKEYEITPSYKITTDVNAAGTGIDVIIEGETKETIDL